MRRTPMGMSWSSRVLIRWMGRGFSEPEHRADALKRQTLKDFGDDLLGVVTGPGMIDNGRAGVRLPLMTQTPETRPGMLSTSSHLDQSIGLSGMMGVLVLVQSGSVGAQFPAMAGGESRVLGAAGDSAAGE
ncbi:MAG: hypothetical protein JOZ17_06830 [Acetobacteraceae bacterium]|nr:hypothetical protein [Acetobacteraceae bacterium]